MATEKTRPGVVITGAAGDMGAALCDSFRADGFLVFAADIVSPRCREGLVPVVADVTDRAAVFALAERASAESRLAVWVNCAGIFKPVSVPQASTEDWNRIIAVNLTGTFHGCAAALSVLSRSGGGRIVNAGSLSGHVGGTGIHPAYGASKAGVHALTKTYALEGARHGVACNAVAPGVLEGRMGGQFADGQLERLARSNPMRRLGTIEEAVAAIRFLADPVRASYLNGVILPVNGGAYMPS
jgi:NAD(P)-dependent dehydrogenase (short-subunit alcohol dehydrogenase family)